MLTVLIPAKPFADAKQRLAEALTPGEREQLARRLLARTLGVARRAFPEAVLTVVTPDRALGAEVRGRGDRVVVAAGEGLNAQLAEAAATIPDGGAVLVLHADLPLLVADDLAALMQAPGNVVVAPDHHEQGTNALLHRGSQHFFAFGPDSFRRHLQLAKAAGITPEIVRRTGLAFDLDTPDDWRQLAVLLGEADTDPGCSMYEMLCCAALPGVSRCTQECIRERRRP